MAEAEAGGVPRASCGTSSLEVARATFGEMTRARGEPEEGASRREVRRDTAARAMEGHRRDIAVRALVRQGLAAEPLGGGTLRNSARPRNEEECHTF